MPDPQYRVVRVISPKDVPGWDRRPPKWQEIADQVRELEPDKTLVLEFDDRDSAERARNAVRDALNLEARAVVVRTRVTDDKTSGKSLLYLTKLNPVPTEKP